MGGFQSLVCTLKISRLALRVGRGNASSLSNRPGRRSAGSRLSGRFVAPTTMTFGFGGGGSNESEIRTGSLRVHFFLGHRGCEVVWNEGGRSGERGVGEASVGA